MLAEVFLDTSILLEAANGAPAAQDRQAIAQGLLTAPFGTSAQVLSEFYELATHGAPTPLEPAVAKAWTDLLAQKPVQATDTALLQAAIVRAQEHELALPDASILIAAEKLGCQTVYTERLTHGQTYGSVRVVNPFLQDTPAEEG